MSSSTASAGVTVRSAGRSEEVATGAGAAAASADAAAGFCSGSAGTEVSSTDSAASAASSTSARTSSRANTRSRSRSTFQTVTSRLAWRGSAAVRAARFAMVGAVPTPTSMMRVTPRSSRTRSWVSIQRTGEQNCQASSSTSRVRARRPGFAAAAPKSARMSASTFDSATSAIRRTNSSVSANRVAVRFGM